MPAQFGPMMPASCPSSNVSETLSSTTWSPKRLWRWVASKRGMLGLSRCAVRCLGARQRGRRAGAGNAAGGGWVGRIGAAEKRRACGRARSALRALTRGGCSSAVSAANVASSATGPQDRAPQGTLAQRGQASKPHPASARRLASEAGEHDPHEGTIASGNRRPRQRNRCIAVCGTTLAGQPRPHRFFPENHRSHNGALDTAECMFYIESAQERLFYVDGFLKRRESERPSHSNPRRPA